ncbi:MAG TPA: hypothetical protein VGB84_06860 [Arachidicoccus sp.]
MKKITIIFMLVALVAMTFNKGIVIFNFYANRSEIALKYCVNKDKPMMHCNGNCFLGKLLKKEQQRENALNDELSKIEVAICKHYFPEIPSVDYNINLTLSPEYFLRNSHLWQLLLTNRLFKPPLVNIS